MKKKKLTELIQKPLRFHHQDIHEELDELKNMVLNLTDELRGIKQDMHEWRNW